MMPYYTEDTLKGFKAYKYACVDNSPLSIYVTHPFWNWVVRFYPSWLAPNTLTLAGFLMVLTNFLLLSAYDWDLYASNPEKTDFPLIPRWVWFVCFVLHFTSHTLDGTDGKQARITGSSSPLGELFDHGVDSLSTVFMPLAIFSFVGRDGLYGGSSMDMFFVTWAIFINFISSHWEKYNTGVLFLPWGYDLALLAIAFLYLYGAVFGGAGIFHSTLSLGGQAYSISTVQLLKWVVYLATGVVTIPMSVYNVLSTPLHRRSHSLLPGSLPLLPIALQFSLTLAWIHLSPGNIIDEAPRVFIWCQGVLFSSHATRLIIAQMTGTISPTSNWMLYPLTMLTIATATLRLSLDQELALLYAFATIVSLAHFHFGVSVVNEIARYLDIVVFSITKTRTS